MAKSIYSMMGNNRPQSQKTELSGMEMVFGPQAGTIRSPISLSNPLPTAQGDSDAVQSLLSGMTQGTRTTSHQPAPGGGMVSATSISQPKMEDFLPQALALDRQAQMQALLKQRGQEGDAIGELRGGLERARGGLKEASSSAEKGADDALEPYRQKHQELQAQREVELETMQGQIDQITQEYTQAVTNLRDEALSALENQAPEQAEQAIKTMSQNARERKENIINQYAQMGLGQDHPAVQAALQQVDEKTMSSTSDVWQRASLAHSQMEAQVRSNYDNYIQSAEGGRAQARLSGTRAKEQGLLQAQDANRAFAQLEASVAQQAKSLSTQLQAQAAQLEIMGSGMLADALRDQTIAWSPIAPLVAANFALQDEPSLPNVQMPNVQQMDLNSIMQGGGAAGGTGGGTSQWSGRSAQQALLREQNQQQQQEYGRLQRTQNTRNRIRESYAN